MVAKTRCTLDYWFQLTLLGRFRLWLTLESIDDIFLFQFVMHQSFQFNFIPLIFFYFLWNYQLCILYQCVINDAIPKHAELLPIIFLFLVCKRRCKFLGDKVIDWFEGWSKKQSVTLTKWRYTQVFPADFKVQNTKCSVIELHVVRRNLIQVGVK